MTRPHVIVALVALYNTNLFLTCQPSKAYGVAIQLYIFHVVMPLGWLGIMIISESKANLLFRTIAMQSELISLLEKFIHSAENSNNLF